MLQKLLEKVFITNKSTHWKTCSSKIDVFKIPYNKSIGNCFQNTNCFSWIKLISVLIYLKYWYYNSHTYSFPNSLTISAKFLTSQLKSLFNTIPIKFFIGFHILSYAIRPRATTSSGYIKPYANPSQSNLISSYIKIIIPYGSNTLSIKKLSF